MFEHHVVALPADVRPLEVPQEAALDLAAIGGAVAHEDVGPGTELRLLQLRGGVHVKIAVGGFMDSELSLTV